MVLFYGNLLFQRGINFRDISRHNIKKPACITPINKQVKLCSFGIVLHIFQKFVDIGIVDHVKANTCCTFAFPLRIVS